jgi:AcrR family transcriptional regulator
MLARAEELQRNATRRRLIAAASRVFAQHGFANARVRQIADAAGVNLAAVNYHFGGKEGLYRATLSYLAGQAQSIRPVRNRRGATPQDRLNRRIYALLERFLGNSGSSTLGRILAHEAMDPTSALEGVLDDALRPELETLFKMIQELAGPDAPEVALMQASVGILGQCLLYQFARPALQRIYPSLAQGPGLCKVLAAQITEMTVGGIERMRETAWEPAASAAVPKK